MATVVGTWAGGAAVPVPPLRHQIGLQADVDAAFSEIARRIFEPRLVN
jgi:hypothetical protein